MTTKSYVNNLVSPLRELFAKEDPENLISHGAPSNEYNGDADTISRLILLTGPRDIEDVFYVVWPVFKHWIGYKEDNLKAKTKYRELSVKVFEALEITEVLSTSHRNRLFLDAAEAAAVYEIVGRWNKAHGTEEGTPIHRAIEKLSSIR